MFGNSQEKAARHAEIERLCALPVAQLAAEMMVAFGPDGQHPGGEIGLGTRDLIEYLGASTHGPKFEPDLEKPVREGLQRLEHANLIYLQLLAPYGGVFVITRLGRQALAEGNVGDYLSEQRPAFAPAS